MLLNLNPKVAEEFGEQILLKPIWKTPDHPAIHNKTNDACDADE